MMLTWRTAAPSPWRLLRRLRRPAAAPIELLARHYSFLPARFRHQGLIHRIARVEHTWEVQGRGATADRRFFAVRCADARRCTLFQDLRAGTWHVQW